MPQEGVLHAVGSSTCSSAAASSGSSHPTCIRVPCRPPCLAAGLQAIAEVAASIKAGYYTVGIAGGVSLLLLGASSRKRCAGDVSGSRLLPANPIGWLSSSLPPATPNHVAGQVESMTTNPMAWEGAINPRVAENQCAQDCLLPMGTLFRCGARL